MANVTITDPKDKIFTLGFTDSQLDRARKSNHKLGKSEEIEPDKVGSFKWYNWLFNCWGIISFVLSIIADINLLSYYHIHHDLKQLAYAISFMMASTLSSAVLCFYGEIFKDNPWEYRFCSEIVRKVLVVLQLGPVMQRFDMLRLGYRLNYQTESIADKKAIAKRIDQTKFFMQTLSIIKSFMKASPMLVLTNLVTISGYRSDTDIPDPPRILTFWLYTSMLAFSLTKFGAQLNEKSPKKIRYPIAAVAFSAHSLMLFNRITAISFCASLYLGSCLGVLAMHFLFVYGYLTYLLFTEPEIDHYVIRADKESSKLFGMCYNFLISTMYLFEFFHFKFAPVVNENFKYVMYMLYLAENTTFMYMWKYSTHRKDYHAVLDGVMLCHFLTIFGSFAFKGLYYFLRKWHNQKYKPKSDSQRATVFNQTAQKVV